MWRRLFGNNPSLEDHTNGNTGYTLTTPPVPTLLLSNRAPTDLEAELISSSIAAVEFEIRLINHCSPRLNPDDGQIDIYKKFIHLQSALLFRQLPPVIMKKIFLYFTEGDGEPSSNKPPWVLGQVCQRWRAIALDTPNLWRNLPPIHLGPSKNPDDVARIFTCLATLLDRCSGRPISFFLHSEVPNPMEYPIIGLLVAHCPQWANVSLELSGITIRRFFDIEGQLDSLHSLEFSLRGRGEPIVNLFESAPRLRTVRVNNLVCPGMLRLPWAQLTSYDDRTAFCDGVFKGFLPNSRLQYLKFSPNRDEKSVFLPRVRWKPVIISCLTTLSIEFWDREYQIKTLFESLTLPALQALVLKFSKYDNVADVDLVKMITRSHCDLEHFTFHGRDSPIQQFLAVMPSLTTLDINDPDPKLITELSHFQDGKWTVVPCLRSLTIHLCKSYKHQYLAMLSRLAGIRCDTVSAFRVGRLLMPVLKTFKVAVHGTENHCLSHFYYASLEPPTTEMEARSADKIANVYASMMKQNPITFDPSCTLPFELDGRNIINEDQSFRMESGVRKRRGRIYTDIMTRLTSLIDSDPQAVAGVYLSDIDYLFYRFTKAFAGTWPYYCEEIADFHSEVAKWSLELAAIAPVLKWDWDNDGYLVYIPYEDRQLTRTTPKFKSQRAAYRKTPFDQLPAEKSFRTLKVEESLQVSAREIIPGRS